MCVQRARLATFLRFALINFTASRCQQLSVLTLKCAKHRASEPHRLVRFIMQYEPADSRSTPAMRRTLRQVFGSRCEKTVAFFIAFPTGNMGSWLGTLALKSKNRWMITDLRRRGEESSSKRSLRAPMQNQQGEKLRKENKNQKMKRCNKARPDVCWPNREIRGA